MPLIAQSIHIALQGGKHLLPSLMSRDKVKTNISEHYHYMAFRSYENTTKLSMVGQHLDIKEKKMINAIEITKRYVTQ